MDTNSNNSNSCEMYWPKIKEEEPEIETRKEANFKMLWNTENTMKLIETLENDCKELWDPKHPQNKDRNARYAKHEYLAKMFNTTVEEITRKIHNLRTQLNNEIRKIKRRQTTSFTGEGSLQGGSGWEYFDALSFLMRTPSSDPFDQVDGVNLALAEFQADEEEEFGAAARALNRSDSNPTLLKIGSVGKQSRVAASAPPPLPPSAHPMMWPEEPVPRIRPGVNADECQIFGDFVASELRTLRSDESRKKLKRMIQKAILQIGEEEDVNTMDG
ncbi:uncharacterized protein LOC113517415 isoform X1 [Galleria mellonella]|uniref:Uncharacterized protein LOC113517415 isoform X1 n=1 Tax=Galleria mellonella TaxID=7137 RepID=A0ABM3MH05_GALME|nr:uncharacterized protein LOC113517415 isoform X1 [Galleria mellonella]